MQSAKYAKLRDGGWGVRVTTNEPLAAGDDVEVVTKSGAVRTEKIEHVLWRGEDRDTPGATAYLCAVRRAPAKEQQAAAPLQAPEPEWGQW